MASALDPTAPSRRRRARLMRATLACALAAVAALAGAARADARFVLGIGDQSAAMLADPRFDALALKDTRVVVPYNVATDPAQLARWAPFLDTAHARGLRVLVAFSRREDVPRRLPSVGEYGAAVGAFLARFPWVRDVTTWNEANHASQPTARRPDLAARYWRLMRSACPGCTVTSPVYLDLATRASTRWLAAFKRATGNRVRLWAIHGYGDLNRGTDRHLAALLKALPGQVWVTEAAGWVAFGTGWKYNEARAARSIRYTFTLVRKYRAKITRWYFYQWRGEPKGSRWDSGVIGHDGRPRPGYAALKAGIARR
jgi:putative glycosyl hydrolase